MIINKIKIRNFGKLKNEEFTFSTGINVLYGENESGKTTLHVFLKSMLYGITRLRGRAAKKDTYSTYEPWENALDYGGTLWFESADKKFRLTRNFYKSCESSEFLCENDGEVMDVEQGDLAAILGISEAVYENTVSVAQLKSVTGPDLVHELQNYMASYQGTGDGFVDVGRAMQMLKMTRKGYQVQEEKRCGEIKKEQEKISVNMDYIQKEKEELEGKRIQLQKREELLLLDGSMEKGEQVLDQRIAAVEKKKNHIMGFMLGTFILTALLAVVLMKFLSWMPLLSAGIVLVGMALLTLEWINLRRAGQELKKRIHLKDRWKQKQEKLQWSRETLEEAYRDKETAYRNLLTEYEEQEQLLTALSPAGEELEALNLAMKTIERLTGNIHGLVGERIRKRTSQILSEITGGKYTEVLMDEEFHMTVNTRDRIISLEALSRGTMEQIYFALRMAAGELLCGKEKFPVILDDVFGMYDEERLISVLKWLSKEKRQVIISTCNKREMELLEKENIPHTKILL